MKKPSDTYLKMGRATQQPEAALLQAYDQCIMSLTRALDSMGEGAVDNAAIGTGIREGHQILLSLCGALDHDVYPELSAKLEQTYLGLMQALTSAHVRNDVDELRRVVDIIMDLRASWTDAVREKGNSQTDQ